MIRVMVRYCDVLALTHTGQLDLADERAAEYANFSSAGQFLAWAIAKITAGLVATYRGNFPEVISSIGQALAALSAEYPLPWRLPARLLLARAYAALGRKDDAERVLADAAEHTGPSVALHEPHAPSPKRGSRPPRGWSAARWNWRWPRLTGAPGRAVRRRSRSSASRRAVR